MYLLGWLISKSRLITNQLINWLLLANFSCHLSITNQPINQSTGFTNQLLPVIRQLTTVIFP